MGHQNYIWKSNCKSELEIIYIPIYLPENQQKYYMISIATKCTLTIKTCSFNS